MAAFEAEKYNIKFMKVSDKNNENIQELFNGIIEDIYNKFYSEEKLNKNKNDINSTLIYLNLIIFLEMKICQI